MVSRCIQLPGKPRRGSRARWGRKKRALSLMLARWNDDGGREEEV